MSSADSKRLNTSITDADGSGLVINSDGSINVAVISGVSGGGILDSDVVVFSKITANGDTTLVTAGGSSVRLHRIYISPDSDGIPCLWYFKFGSGTALHKTWFSSVAAYRDFKFGSGSSDGLQGDSGENLVFNVDRANSNVLVTVLYSLV